MTDDTDAARVARRSRRLSDYPEGPEREDERERRRLQRLARRPYLPPGDRPIDGPLGPAWAAWLYPWHRPQYPGRQGARRLLASSGLITESTATAYLRDKGHDPGLAVLKVMRDALRARLEPGLALLSRLDQEIARKEQQEPRIRAVQRGYARWRAARIAAKSTGDAG